MKNKRVLIVDSSVAVKWLSDQNEMYLSQAYEILSKAEKGTIEIALPELAKYEICNALLNKNMGEGVNVPISTLFNLLINFVPLDKELAQNTMEIAMTDKITFYDAAFLALAKKLEAPLITDNPKHQKKLHTPEIKVIALKNYR